MARKFPHLIEGVVVLTRERTLVLSGIKSLQVTMDPQLLESGLDVSLHASHKDEIETPESDPAMLAEAIKQFWSRLLCLRVRQSRRVSDAAPRKRTPKKKSTSSRTRK